MRLFNFIRAKENDLSTFLNQERLKIGQQIWIYNEKYDLIVKHTIAHIRMSIVVDEHSRTTVLISLYDKRTIPIGKLSRTEHWKFNDRLRYKQPVNEHDHLEAIELLAGDSVRDETSLMCHPNENLNWVLKNYNKIEFDKVFLSEIDAKNYRTEYLINKFDADVKKF
ncbi:MAG: hypothetical protein NXI20_28390 [bacterium]|nr:hypothetical protein [bacterium]